jgi:urate oxidase
MSFKLTENHYGKSEVRLTKIIRDGDRHQLLEFSVSITLTGDFQGSYTSGDNSKIIATDSMKNTVYVLAKERDFTTPEAFAIMLAEHFTITYPQVLSAEVEVAQSNWNRIEVGGTPHDHAFVSGGAELHTAVATAAGNTTTVTGGVTELLVLKTTRSAFKDFVTDRYRTLKDAHDRILATSVTANWDYNLAEVDFAVAHEKIRSTMLNVFATQMSHAVQQTMYEMGKAALQAAPEIDRIRIRMPNKHRIPVNLQPFDLENKNEIFVWTDEPFGDIGATIERGEP